MELSELETELLKYRSENWFYTPKSAQCFKQQAYSMICSPHPMLIFSMNKYIALVYDAKLATNDEFLDFLNKESDNLINNTQTILNCPIDSPGKFPLGDFLKELSKNNSNK